VMQNDTPIIGHIEAVNAEYDYEGINRYASIFTFVPSTTIEGNVTVTVQSAVNYADTAMEDVFTQTTRATLKPESLVVSETAAVVSGGTTVLNIRLLPAEAAEGKAITIHNASPSIVGVDTTSVTADENGCASVAISGKLPGNAVLTVWAEGTDLRSVVDVTVTKMADVVFGDVNLDGVLDTTDARYVLKAIVGLTAPLTAEEIKIADVNQDETINSADVRRMLLVIAGRTESDSL